MDITFSAANAVGLNNPGTEIITLVKGGSGTPSIAVFQTIS